MSITSATVWEVRTTGNDLNGAGFDSSTAGAGTDYSQQDAAQLSLTDLANASNTTLTSATGGFTSAMIGNLIRISSGTNALAGYYRITAYTNTNTVLIDRTCSTGGDMSSGVGSVGGAAATPGIIGSAAVNGNRVYIKAGTYTNTTNTSNVSGGRVNSATTALWEGYETTRGDLGSKPYIDASSVTAADVFTVGAIRNVKIKSAGSSYCVALTTGYADFCEALGGAGFNLSSDGARVRFCWAHDLTVSGFVGGTSDVHAYRCVANNCSGSGFTGSAMATFGCLAYDNAFENFTNKFTYECSSIGAASGKSGFDTTCTESFNCVATDNGGYGWKLTTAGHQDIRYGSASYNNTSGDKGNAAAYSYADHYHIDITDGSPWTDRAGDDYSPNATSLRGALLRNAAKPDTWPNGISTNSQDLGAIQSAASGSSGTVSVQASFGSPFIKAFLGWC